MTGWNERDSRVFLEYARFFVPDRGRQTAVVRDLIPAQTGPFQVVELCSGEGLLAEVILEGYPGCTLLGLDGSATMRRAARARLARFRDRFHCMAFKLAAIDWEALPRPIHAVVSSLCIHHLDGPGKRELFIQVYRALSPGGAFIVADLIRPAGEHGHRLAATTWDDIVRRQGREIEDGGAVFDGFQRLKWNHFRTPDPSDKPSGLLEQLKWLEAAGFVEVDVYWMEAGHAIYGGRRPGWGARGMETPGV